MPGPLDFTVSPWVETGVTTDTDGFLYEDTASNRHSVYQDVQTLVDGGLGRDAVFKARVRPVDRTRCWIGCRQNNGLYMASFLLTGGGTVTSTGANVTSATITAVGDGSYWCRVNFVGTLSTTATVFAVGAMLADATQTYLGTGATALQVTEAQLIKGTADVAYVTTGDRSTYADEATDDGAQDATLPGSSAPYNMDAGYTVFSGGSAITVDDFTEDLDALTVCVLFDWDGTTGAEKILAQHYSSGSRSWKLSLTSAGLLQVTISGNGTTDAKVYTSADTPDTNDKTLASFTWDGTSLRLYYNDTELTTGGSTLTKDTDNSLSGALANSTANIEIGGAHYGKLYAFRMYGGAAATPTEIDGIAATYSVSGLPTGTPGGGGGGDFPTTLSEMETWLTGKGASTLYYVDNLSGSDGNTGLSTGAAWATIGKAASVVGPGDAVIIRGRNGRFFEQVTIGASGSAGNLVWYAGDPENPPIMDASQTFSATWTDQGSSRWRAPYGLTRPYSASAGYQSNCTTGNCVDDSVWMSHQLIYNNVQLTRLSQSSTPTTLAQGECFFEVGTGSYETPQYVWCRLPADANPNAVTMRVGSNKTKLLDYSAYTWLGFPGGTSGQEAEGRSYVGLVNLHFRYGCNIRKVGMVAVRGTGWHVEHCSFMDANTIGLTIHGTGHYIYNCHARNCGQQGFQSSYMEGTEVQRCFIVNNNLHYYPPSWDAGGWKITQSGQTSRNEIHECLIESNEGVGIWLDDQNGVGNPSEEGFFLHHLFVTDNAKGGIMYEISKFVNTEDTVIWNNRADDEGQSANMLGPGLRSQAAGNNSYLRVVSVYNAGKGWLYKADDDRLEANEDTVSYCAFIANARQTDIDQTRAEYQGGDDANYPARTWDTSVITNVLVSNNTAGVSLFHDRTASTTTNTVATFEGWSGASGTVSVADPANVVSDHTDERGCYQFDSAYSAYAPMLFTHPDDFSTNWTPPS